MRTLLRLTCVFTILLCGAGIVAVVQDLVLGPASVSWPSVQGTVVETDIVTIPGTGGPDSPTTYDPYVRYRYAVGGTMYASTTISFPDPPNFLDTQDARAYRARYHPGMIVTVYHHPRKHARSCLVPGGPNPVSSIGSILMLAVVMGLCVFGFFELKRWRGTE